MSEVWVNPGYDTQTNAGDIAVLTLAEPLPASATVAMAGRGDAAYKPGTERDGLRLGRHQRARQATRRAALGRR